ncbi:MAG: AraC family transcriptional regulator [Bacteroidota bacterium]
MKFLPQDPDLRRHVDHFWIVKNATDLFAGAPPLLDFPGLSPELIIVLDGHFTIHYRGKTERVNHARLYSFLYDRVLLDFSKLRAFAFVRFQPRNLSSLLPFLSFRAEDLMRRPVCTSETAFGPDTTRLFTHLATQPPAEIAAELETWLSGHFRPEREGFLADMATDLPHGGSPAELMERTGYSYATLERHFKRDTGLTPKRYQTLQRFRRALNDVYLRTSSDWTGYVARHGYYDQSHFIREVKKHTGFTPGQLLHQPAFQRFRPG